MDGNFFLGEKNVIVSYTLPGQEWMSPKFFIQLISCSLIFAASIFTVVLSSVLFYNICYTYMHTY